MRHLVLALLLLALGTAAAARSEEQRPPNVVFILTDDQGYADVGCYGAEGFETPHLDRLAAEGVRFTDFHVAQAICSASRAAFLTGCYSERVGILGALGPSARHGLDPEEETLADLLKAQGYATCMVGKWHLGHRAPFLPTEQGFDEVFGLPYSNDMWPLDDLGVPTRGYPELQMLDGDGFGESVTTLAQQAQLTERYTLRALDFIERSREKPFFLYLAHSMPHVPLGTPLRMAGVSEQGAYGDVISEIDASTGRIMAALDEHGLTDDTLVVFTSDNGPWQRYGDHAGSAGELREGKMSIFEGGTRVPFIARLPRLTPAGAECDGLVAAMDVLPTVAALCGARAPARRIDGVSVEGLLRDPAAASPREVLYHYYGASLNALRRGRWKLVLPHTYVSSAGVRPGSGGYRGPESQGRAGLELYDLETDPGEQRDLAGLRPDVVAELQQLVSVARAALGDRNLDTKGSEVRGPGRLPAERAHPGGHRARGRVVFVDREPAPRYAGRGSATLTDGRIGTEAFDDGAWLGWRGGSIEATVDLGSVQDVRKVAASFLRSQSSWIFLPREVEVAVSRDGGEYEIVGRFAHEPVPAPGEEAREVAITFGAREARMVRIRARSVGDCPGWHAGAGETGWIFMDEIVVD